MKTCIRCGEAKTLDFFVKGRGYCKACKSAYDQKYRLANRDRREARTAQWRRDNPEKVAAYLRKARDKYRAKYPEKARASFIEWCAKNPEKYQRAQQRYYENNRDRNNAKANKRRALTLRAVPNWADYDAIREIYRVAARNRQHVDHVVPLRSELVCGLHWEGNLQMLSARENIRKYNRFWPDMP